MALHDNGFVAKSHSSRKTEDSIYSLLNVCLFNNSLLYPRRDWCLWKMYWKDNPQCYFLCQVKDSQPFLFQAKGKTNQMNWVQSALKLQSQIGALRIGTPPVMIYKVA